MPEPGAPRILFVAPTPPLHTGPEVATKLLLESSLARTFELLHVRSNVRKANRARGTIDVEAVMRLAQVCWAIAWKRITRRPRVLYCAIGSNRSGFLRDLCIVTLAKLLGLKVVAHYRGGNFANFYRLASPSMKRLIRFGLRQMDLVIVQAHRLKQEFDGIYPADQLRVLYNGIGPVALPPGGRSSSGRDVNLLFIGGVSFAKGFHDLMLAFKSVISIRPHVRLMFAGEIIRLSDERNIVPDYFSGETKDRFLRSTPEILEFVEQCSRYNATYLGSIQEDEKRRVLRDADIFVLPSYSEGFSVAVLEALAYGLPVVTTAVGAMPEIIADGENGFVLTPGDYSGVARRIVQLVDDVALRRAMGARNAQKVRDQFDIEDVARGMGAIFSELIHSTAMAPRPASRVRDSR